MQGTGGRFREEVNTFTSFRFRKNCQNSGNKPLLFIFIRRAVNLTVILTEEFHFDLIRVKLPKIYFWKERLTPYSNNITDGSKKYIQHRLYV